MANLISPFFHFTRIDLEHHQKLNPGNRMTKYNKAVQYGRPLFELIRRKSKSGRLPPGKEKAVQQSMFLSRSTEVEAACFSVLATCVQMGQVAYGFSSDLVSRGYASFTYLPEKRSSGVADICFFPDPVLAHLAMRQNNNLSRSIATCLKFGWGKHHASFSRACVDPQREMWARLEPLCSCCFVGTNCGQRRIRSSRPSLCRCVSGLIK